MFKLLFYNIEFYYHYWLGCTEAAAHETLGGAKVAWEHLGGAKVALEHLGGAEAAWEPKLKYSQFKNSVYVQKKLKIVFALPDN